MQSALDAFKGLWSKWTDCPSLKDSTAFAQLLQFLISSFHTVKKFMSQWHLDTLQKLGTGDIFLILLYCFFHSCLTWVLSGYETSLQSAIGTSMLGQWVCYKLIGVTAFRTHTLAAVRIQFFHDRCGTQNSVSPRSSYFTLSFGIHLQL